MLKCFQIENQCVMNIKGSLSNIFFFFSFLVLLLTNLQFISGDLYKIKLPALSRVATQSRLWIILWTQKYLQKQNNLIRPSTRPQRLMNSPNLKKKKPTPQHAPRQIRPLNLWHHNCLQRRKELIQALTRPERQLTLPRLGGKFPFKKQPWPASHKAKMDPQTKSNIASSLVVINKLNFILLDLTGTSVWGWNLFQVTDLTRSRSSSTHYYCW